MKALTMKLDESLLKDLRAVSEKTHISQSALVRQGIEWIVWRNKEETLSPKFVQTAQNVLKRNRRLFKKLGDA